MVYNVVMSYNRTPFTDTVVSGSQSTSPYVWRTTPTPWIPQKPMLVKSEPGLNSMSKPQVWQGHRSSGAHLQSLRKRDVVLNYLFIVVCTKFSGSDGQPPRVNNYVRLIFGELIAVREPWISYYSTPLEEPVILYAQRSYAIKLYPTFYIYFILENDHTGDTCYSTSCSLMTIGIQSC